MRLPDFFIAGHQKSGTTALYEMLRTHPQVFMPERKEPSYFVPEIVKRPLSLEQYAALFEPAGAEQRAGEATPTYLWSHTAAGRIHEQCPDAKIIAILREPAEFLRSLHLQFLRIDVETEKDFAKALALDDERSQGRRIPRNSPRPEFFPYAEHVRYVEQLERYHSLFGPEQMLVLIYEDYREDNAATLAQIERFLEIEQIPLQAVESNRSVSIRSPRLRALTRSLYLGRGPAGALKPAIKALTSPAARRRLLALQNRAQREQVSAPDEQTMDELRQRLSGEVAALGEYLGRDLGARWGYPLP